jgi:hypothetical protein
LNAVPTRPIATPEELAAGAGTVTFPDNVDGATCNVSATDAGVAGAITDTDALADRYPGLVALTEYAFPEKL